MYRVGTRASKLARLQTTIVVEKLKAQFPQCEIEEVAVTTGGDKIVDKPIAELGFRGVFVKELEDALFRGEVDFVVHSLKDVPTDVPDGLTIAAVLDREDPRDVLATNSGTRFLDLPQGSRVATSSRRRAAQLKQTRPDISFIDIRGNIETRLRKLDEDYCDGTLLAHAGLLRLNLLDKVSQVFEPDELTPAAGQGALAIECRAGDTELIEMLAKISDDKVKAEIECERAFLSQLGGGCSVPIGALARVDDNTIELTGCIAALDGSAVFRMKHSGAFTDAPQVGEELAFRMMENGARKTVEELRLTLPNKISPP